MLLSFPPSLLDSSLALVDSLYYCISGTMVAINKFTVALTAMLASGATAGSLADIDHVVIFMQGIRHHLSRRPIGACY